jgi:hypothetical protein
MHELVDCTGLFVAVLGFGVVVVGLGVGVTVLITGLGVVWTGVVGFVGVEGVFVLDPDDEGVCDKNEEPSPNSLDKRSNP